MLFTSVHIAEISSIPRPIDAEFWERFEELLDAVLDALERRYAIVFDRVDQLAASEPTAGNAKIIRARLPQNHDVANEFFRKLDDPAWIGPLEVAGIFSEPPSPVRQDKGIAYPSWPALDYLARMTSRAPTDVARVALAIPTTDNSQDLRRTRTRSPVMLPPALSAPFADRLEIVVGRRSLEPDCPIWDARHESQRWSIDSSRSGQPEAAIRALRGDIATSHVRTTNPVPADLLREVRCPVPSLELPWLRDRLFVERKQVGAIGAYELFSEPTDVGRGDRSRCGREADRHARRMG